MSQSTPEWRPIPGYEGCYEVSDTGVIRSLRTGLLLSPFPDRDGYMQTALYNAAAGLKPRVIKVHRVVLEAFVGPLPLGMVTRHLDGNPANNHLSNIRYGTHSENLRDKVRHGTDHNAIKTECPRGHAYDLLNTYIAKNGSRRCRACHREAVTAARIARRQGVAA